MRALARPRRRRGRRPAPRRHRPEPGAGLHSARPPAAACTRRSKRLGLGGAGAREIDDVVTCPGAYSCNLALTKSMEPRRGAARHGGATTATRRCAASTIKVSGCPNSCGQHWIADIGFYGNARKIDGQRSALLPDAARRRLRRAGHHALRPGRAEHPGAPRAGGRAPRARSLHRQPRGRARRFRDYVLRHKVETFREMLDDLAQARRSRSRRFTRTGATTRPSR